MADASEDNKPEETREEPAEESKSTTPNPTNPDEEASAPPDYAAKDDGNSGGYEDDDDDPPPKKKKKKYASRFLYFGDPKSIIFAAMQLIALSYVLGKMLKPDERLSLPIDKEYWTYIKHTFCQYGIQSGHLKTLETALEAIINGETSDVMSGGAMQQMGKIALAIGFIQGHVTQLTLPLYYFSRPITRRVCGDNVCDGLFITMGKKPTSPKAYEGYLNLFSLAYHCWMSTVVMFYGSVALMHTSNLSQAVTQFFFAVMITDFSMLKDFTKKRGLKYGTMFLVAIKPTQRTLHLEGKEDIHTLERYSTAAEWTFFGAASIVTAKAAATAP